jgi:hypothetical protein
VLLRMSVLSGKPYVLPKLPLEPLRFKGMICVVICGITLLLQKLVIASPHSAGTLLPQVFPHTGLL